MRRRWLVVGGICVVAAGAAVALASSRTFTMWRTRTTIRGSVVDHETGAPVADAEIVVARFEQELGPEFAGLLPPAARSRADGSFETVAQGSHCTSDSERPEPTARDAPEAVRISSPMHEPLVLRRPWAAWTKAGPQAGRVDLGTVRLKRR